MGPKLGMDRRDFPRLGFGGLVGASFQTAAFAPVPRVNGGINIQPVPRLDPGAGFTPPLIVPGIVDAQRKALYELFWFDLFDLGAEGFRLIDLEPTLEGSIEAVPDSDSALDWLRSRVGEALAGIPAAPYRDLVPDITLYFPTEEDLRILDATSSGPRPWHF
jgi:hypothetical protein